MFVLIDRENVYFEITIKLLINDFNLQNVTFGVLIACFYKIKIYGVIYRPCICDTLVN